MATFSAVSRQHILQAIAEWDSRGGDDFLGVYGFPSSPGAALVHEGRDYDSTAILGVAHRYATGRLATLDEFHAGPQGVADILRRRGFVVRGGVEERPAERASVRSPRSQAGHTTSARGSVPRSPAARRAAQVEQPVAVCPTCFMTLPATGVCDTCG